MVLPTVVPSFGIDFRQENRARPLRSTLPDEGEESCPLEEELFLPSELDLHESSEPLSPSEDSSLQQAVAAAAALAVALAAWAAAAASSCISLAKSAAVKAHLSALGLTGVVLEMKKLQVPEGELIGTPSLELLAGTAAAAVEQKGRLGGILMGGGILLRFAERELVVAEDVPPFGAVRVGDTVIGDGDPVEAPVDETVRFSRGPRRV